jgi:hypothetical protein
VQWEKKDPADGRMMECQKKRKTSLDYIDGLAGL